MMTDQAPQRTRLTKSKAIASTTAIQTLEIITTAVITGQEGDNSPPLTTNDEVQNERKQPHHHHYHLVRSPTFETPPNLNSPLPSPQIVNTPVSMELTLPPPLKSEAVVALQDAANVTNVTKRVTRKCVSTELELFDSSFFSAVLLIQWSNLVGPKIEKIWSAEPLEDQLQKLIGRQVLNGEMGRDFKGTEPKWIILYKQAIICTAFLFLDPTLDSLSALVFVVPLRYLRHFSHYFQILSERIPLQLIDPLVKLRKIHKCHAASWSLALKYFTIEKLVPFVKSIMYLESVSLPIEGIKMCQTILDYGSKQMLDSPFIAKVITSHLQTFGSTLLVGNTLTAMNMVINTLALFLTTEERSRSSHARKQHQYAPDLFLQGLLQHDLDEMNIRVDLAVLESTYPTTFVDMTNFIVKRTPLYQDYTCLKSEYQDAMSLSLEDNLASFVIDGSTSMNNMNDWSKRQTIFERNDKIAPMVQSLIDEIRRIPYRLREPYIRQWRRALVKKAVALIKYVEDNIDQIDLVSKIKDALALYNEADFNIVLTQTEKLKPGTTKLLATHFNVVQQ